MQPVIDRRDFIQLGAAAGLATGLSASLHAQEPAAPIRLGVVGVGSRGTYLLRVALAAGVQVPALCDINEANLTRATELVAQARDGAKPEGYSRGPEDYLRMLDRDDLDAILVGTGMQTHAPISVAAMKAGKHVLCEVAAAMTLDECWQLVDTVEATGKIYMLAENCCYWEHVMMIDRMVEESLFGELTFAECGYVHDCRSLKVKPDGSLTWRGEMIRDQAGDNYPTHNLGPVARWFGINHGNRFVSLVSRATGQRSWQAFLAERLPPDHPTRRIEYKGADSVSTLIQTASGALIDVRYDISSPRPAWGPYFALQGTKGSFETRTQRQIWLEGRTEGRKWQPLADYATEFEPPKWRQFREQAQVTGHGGADFFVIHEFLEAVRSGGPSPVDVYDAVAWSCIIPLSHNSITEGGREQEVPDFTRGKWQA